jgi:hypothetical protein
LSYSGRYGTALYGDAIYGVNYAELDLPGVRWDLIAMTPSGDALGDLIGAKSRKFTFRLNEPSTVEWSMSGMDPGAALVDELSTDVEAWRNGVRLLRARVGATSDDVGADDHQMTAAAVDYRGLLNRRTVWTAATFTADDQAAIAWDLIAATQALTGGNLGITDASTATGHTRDRDYAAGKNLGEAIQELSDVFSGFDWEISPELEFKVWSPGRGVVRDFAAVWGDTVASVRRQVDPAQYANAIRSSGAEGVTAATRTVADLAGRVEGRFEAQLGNTDTTTTTALGESADWELSERSVIRPSYTVRLKPGVWDGPATLWLGDTCRLVVVRGRLAVDTEARVHEISVAAGDDGGEVVEVTFDRPRASFVRRASRDASRIDRLERR